MDTNIEDRNDDSAKYENILDDDFDYEPDEGELTDELCQECKKGYMVKQFVANGYDDYTKTWTCNNCGVVESE